jgi:hypothetical protein
MNRSPSSNLPFTMYRPNDPCHKTLATMTTYTSSFICSMSTELKVNNPKHRKRARPTPHKTNLLYTSCLIHLHGYDACPYMIVRNDELVTDTETLAQAFAREGEVPANDEEYRSKPRPTHGMAFPVDKHPPKNPRNLHELDVRRSIRRATELVADATVYISVICRVDEGNCCYSKDLQLPCL